MIALLHLTVTHLAVIAQDLSGATGKISKLQTDLGTLLPIVVGIAAMLFLLFKGHKSPSFEALLQRFGMFLGIAFLGGTVIGGIFVTAVTWGKDFVK